MSAALFLGNSMLASVKLAHDLIGADIDRECRFYCARGADLFFTEVADGRIRGVRRASASEDDFHAFYPDSGRKMSSRYAQKNKALIDVREQFMTTGGSEEIDLADVAAVFYVAGVSPYDFTRLGGTHAPLSRALRRELLAQMLDEHFLLRRQIEAIKAWNPSSRHYFIGSPLKAATDKGAATGDASSVAYNREIVRGIVRGYLFDDVFMPDEDLLDASLLTTKAKFCTGGQEEAARFQGETASGSDNAHMNRDYGVAVFKKFIVPALASLPV